MALESTFGTTCWHSWFVPLTDAPGQVVSVCLLARDLSEHEKTITALRASQERFRLIAEKVACVLWIANPAISQMLSVSPAYEKIWRRTCESLYQQPRSFLDAVHPEDRQRVILGMKAQQTHMKAVFLDPKFNFIWVNRAYAQTCGHEPSYFPGKNHFGLYPDEEDQRVFQRAVDTGEPFFAVAKPFEFPDQPERGVTYWDWSIVSVKEGGDKVTGLVFTLAEVTERIQAEETKEKLEALHHQLHKVGSLSRMAGAIAQHFNHQLQAVMMNLEMAQLELPPDKGPGDNLNEAMAAARKAVEVSNLLLTYLGQTVTRPETLDVSAVCNRHLAVLRAVAPKDAELECLPVPRPTIKADANQIQQVLDNLVTNAWGDPGQQPIPNRVVATRPSLCLPGSSGSGLRNCSSGY